MTRHLDVTPLSEPGTPDLAGFLSDCDPRPPAEALFAAAAGDPRCALVAVERGAPIGVLYGAIFDAGYRILGVHAREGALAQVTGAFLEYLRRAFPGQRIEASLGDGPAGEALAAAGAALFLDQVVYRRELSGLGEEADPFSYRPYAETGKSHLVDALSRIFGAGGRTAGDALREVDRMLFECTTGEGPPALWRTAYLDGDLAGVVLGNVHEGAGTLAYFGLLPHHRGKGLGRALHAAALRALAAAGATTYEDATAGDNAAMQRIFEQNGCRPAGSLRHYLVCAPKERGHLADFDALVAHLFSERHAVEVLEPGAWLTAPMQFGPHDAVVEVGWIRDAQLVQVLHTYPHRVTPAELDRVARSIATLNASLNAPGFILDEEAMTVGFRQAVFLDERGGLSVHHLRRALATVVHAVAVHEPWWRALLLDTAGPRYADPLLSLSPP